MLTRTSSLKAEGRGQRAEGKTPLLPYPLGASPVLQDGMSLVGVQAPSKQETFCLLPFNFCLRLTAKI